MAHWAKGSAPVDLFLAFGIGAWFGLKAEPELPFYLGLVAGFLVLAGLARFGPWGLRPLAVALACAAAGALACGARVWVVTAPMLAQPYYGPVQGRLVDIDRSQSDAIRLMLDQVVLTEVSPNQTPAKVHISFKGAPQAARY